MRIKAAGLFRILFRVGDIDTMLAEICSKSWSATASVW